MILMSEERASVKKIVVTLCLAIMLLALCVVLQGCGIEKVPAEAVGDNEIMFYECQKVPYGRILVDRETRVMYWMSEGQGNYGTLTLLVNSDGTPKVWDGEIQ